MGEDNMITVVLIQDEDIFGLAQILLNNGEGSSTLNAK